MRHPLTRLALLVWLVFWGRLVINSLTTPSPAREFEFTDAEGRTTERPYCHGPAWVIDGVPWMMCAQGAATTQRDFLTEFDLAAGRARLVRALPDPAWRGISAAARRPDGGVVFVDGQGAVQRWDAGGVWVDLGLPGFKMNPCVAWTGAAVEVASARGGGAVEIARQGDAGWATRAVPAPAPAEGSSTRFEACEWTPDGWRLTWARVPDQVGSGPVPVELWSALEAAPPTLEQTLALDPAQHEPYVSVSEGRALVRSGLLARTGGVARWWGAPPFERGDDGRWRAPALPAFAMANFAGVDLVFGGPRAGQVLNFDAGRPTARVEGRWITTSPTRVLRFGVVGADLAEPTPWGPPVVAGFWLTPGFKLLPDAADGFWALGALGEAYVHLDAGLARTDAHGFFERAARALTDDRAKRNSDFYLNLATAKRLGFAWVFLALPLLLLASRRRLPVGAALYLLGVAAGGWWAWQLSGTYW